MARAKARGWLGTLVWLGGLLVVAVGSAVGLNLLVIAPLMPEGPSPRRSQPTQPTQTVQPAPPSSLGVSAGVAVSAEPGSGPGLETPEEDEEAIDLDRLAAEAAAARDAEPAPARPRRRAAESTRSYRALGPRSYLVSRSWLREQSKNGPGASAVPYRVDGQIKGYRLRGVGGPLARLGLRSGDVITSVNGQPVSSPDTALRAYQRAYSASRVRVVLLRGGAPAAFSYRFVD